MKVLNNDVRSLNFDDVVSFCKEAVPEGVEIDYKRELPSKGLAKFFAAFSNTRGGILIIGVDEDRTTGLPSFWEGMDDNAKVVEQIHQTATNITPLPNYIVHKTDSVNGKVFILVRIMEGENPPYYVQNESSVWVRTGNITNPIELSKPDYLELLFGKREKAEKARNMYLKRCTDVYAGAIKLEEKRRLQLIAEAKRKGDGSEKNHFQKPLGTDTTLCETVVMPLYPIKPLAKISEIQEKLREIRESRDFPNPNMNTMPEGLYYYTHNYDGRLMGHQIYANGLVNALYDVLTADTQKDVREIRLYAILWNVHHVLNAAKKLYSIFGYSGNIYYQTTLQDVNDVTIVDSTINGPFKFDSNKENLLRDYRWEKVFSTSALNNPEEFANLFYDLTNEMYWSFGFGELTRIAMARFCKDSNMHF